jgi:hypothetical protein
MHPKSTQISVDHQKLGTRKIDVVLMSSFSLSENNCKAFLNSALSLLATYITLLSSF